MTDIKRFQFKGDYIGEKYDKNVFRIDKKTYDSLTRELAPHGIYNVDGHNNERHVRVPFSSFCIGDKEHYSLFFRYVPKNFDKDTFKTYVLNCTFTRYTHEDIDGYNVKMSGFEKVEEKFTPL